MGRLDGKVAVITGAAGGIGREAALLFSSEGARVCVADVGREAGEKTAAECQEAFFFQADVSDPKSVQAMYAETAKRYGRIDVLYNNAGIMPPDDDSILTTEPDAWDRVQAVNAKGVYLCCKYGIPHLLEAGGGSVINVASFVALVRAAGRASERAVPGSCRDAAADAPLRSNAGRVRAAPRASAHGAAGEGARDRQRRPVPGQRRVELCQRHHVPRGRGPHGCLRNSGVGTELLGLGLDVTRMGIGMHAIKSLGHKRIRRHGADRHCVWRNDSLDIRHDAEPCRNGRKDRGCYQREAGADPGRRGRDDGLSFRCGHRNDLDLLYELRCDLAARAHYRCAAGRSWSTGLAVGHDDAHGWKGRGDLRGSPSLLLREGQSGW